MFAGLFVGLGIAAVVIILVIIAFIAAIGYGIYSIFN